MERRIYLKRILSTLQLLSIVSLTVILFVSSLTCKCHADNACQGNSQSQIIGLKQLAPLFKKQLFSMSPWPSRSIKIKQIAAYPSEVRVPKGHTQFILQPTIGGNLLGRVSFLYAIKVNGHIARRIRVTALVEVYHRVICASRPLSRGHVITSTDLAMVKMPLSRIRGRAIENRQAALGMALRQSVWPGQVITQNMLVPPVIIHKGDKVTIIADSPYLSVRATGLACQNGSKGQMVWVKNLNSKREILAKVTGPETVVVTF